MGYKSKLIAIEKSHLGSDHAWVLTIINKYVIIILSNKRWVEL